MLSSAQRRTRVQGTQAAVYRDRHVYAGTDKLRTKFDNPGPIVSSTSDLNLAKSFLTSISFAFLLNPTFVKFILSVQRFLNWFAEFQVPGRSIFVPSPSWTLSMLIPKTIKNNIFWELFLPIKSLLPVNGYSASLFRCDFSGSRTLIFFRLS